MWNLQVSRNPETVMISRVSRGMQRAPLFETLYGLRRKLRCIQILDLYLVRYGMQRQTSAISTLRAVERILVTRKASRL
jgi:hypothetical protein